jgi:hypothetical protein
MLTCLSLDSVQGSQDVTFPTWLAPAFRALLLSLMDTTFSRRPSAEHAWRRLCFISFAGADVAVPGGPTPSLHACTSWLSKLRLQSALVDTKVDSDC